MIPVKEIFPNGDPETMEITDSRGRKLKTFLDKKQDLLIVGIAADFEDAAALAGRIICEAYKKTGGYDVNSFLFGKGCCE